MKKIIQLLFLITLSFTLISCKDDVKTSKLIIEEVDSAVGQVSGANTYLVGSVAVVNALPTREYVFVGWFENEKLLSKASNYSFYMPDGDLTLTAVFNTGISDENSEYLLNVSTTSVKSKVAAPQKAKTNELVFASAMPDETENFEGWYSGDVLISTSPVYLFYMPSSNVNLVARFKTQSTVVVPTEQYLLTILTSCENAGMVMGTSGLVALDDQCYLFAEALAGNEFVGWYDGEKLMSTNPVYCFRMPRTDLTMVAKFNPIEITEKAYKVVTSIFDDTKGKTFGDTAYNSGDIVTLQAVPKSGYRFVGWYDGINRMSAETNYTFIAPNKDLNLKALFVEINSPKVKVNVAIQPMGGWRDEATLTKRYEIFGSGEYEIGEPFEITFIDHGNGDERSIFNGWFLPEEKLITADITTVLYASTDMEIRGYFVQ